MISIIDSYCYWMKVVFFAFNFIFTIILTVLKMHHFRLKNLNKKYSISNIIGTKRKLFLKYRISNLILILSRLFLYIIMCDYIMVTH